MGLGALAGKGGDGDADKVRGELVRAVRRNRSNHKPTRCRQVQNTVRKIFIPN